MKILVVEDDRHLLETTVQLLRSATYSVDAVSSVDEAAQAVDVNQYDCIVLDVMLPDGSGFDLCKNLRENGIPTPIIIMTARDALDDRVKGLELGADDYVQKPVDGRELVARVRALIRRNSKQPMTVLRVGDLEIDTAARRVKRAGRLIELTAKEFSVLELLARHSDEVVTRTMLMEHAWGSDFESFSNVIDVYIRNLRRKIDVAGVPRLIHTVRGGGYSLSDQR